jgi:preprotein translocase subunit SecA
MKEGDAIEHPMLSKSVERAQRKVEERNFLVRKNILEYDEVMEHQRGFFYGLRQQILEGNDIKQVIFDYIAEAVGDRVNECLSRSFVPTRIGEWAVERLSWAVEIEKLHHKSKDTSEVIHWLRQEAKAEARQTIDVTLGEYMPYEADPVDWDLKGLAEWARTRFNVEMKPHLVREMSHNQVMAKLIDAAIEAIDAADLDAVDQFLEPHYGIHRVVSWAKSKFDIEVDPEVLIKCESDEDRIDLIVTEASRKYVEREVSYPVEYAMDWTMALMREDPSRAAAFLVDWVNKKFAMGWDETIVKKKMPQQIHDELMEASRKMFGEGGLDEEISRARAMEDDDQLAEHLASRFGVELKDGDLGETPEERPDRIRSLIENAMRAEITQFESFVLIEILDNTWKDHLYAMDQLRETISYRAFSQQDPRIEYKREGANYFEQMKQAIRDKVTDIIFKARLQPSVVRQAEESRRQQAAMRARMAAQRAEAQQMQRPAPADNGGLLEGGDGDGGIVGANLGGGGRVTVEQAEPDTRRRSRPKGKKRR